MPGVQTVAVVEGDFAVRQVLSFLLESAGLEALTFRSGELFLKSTDAHAFDCLVADVRMPGMSGVELLRRCRVKRPDLPIILIAADADLDVAVDAMKLGAVDFLKRPCSDERFVTAVRAALSRSGSTNDERKTPAFHEKLDDLSERERDVLTCLLKGSPSKAIAAELGISVRTVEVHRGRVIAKMGARNAADLVRLVMSTKDAAVDLDQCC